MNRWKTFWRSRKQSDRIKVMLYLGIAASVFLVLSAVDIANLVKRINTPTEYILACDRISGTGLEQLMDIDGVSAVTPARNSSLTVKYNTVETSMQMTCVSKEYAKNVYGVERSGEMMTIFANSKSYERVLSTLPGAANDPELRNEIRAEYQDGDRYKTCRIVNIQQKTNTEDSFAFTIMADSALKMQADSIRVFVPEQDTEQTAVDTLQGLGYSIMNREDTLSFHNEIDRRFIEMKYHLIIAVMCCVWIVTLHVFTPDKQR